MLLCDHQIRTLCVPIASGRYAYYPPGKGISAAKFLDKPMIEPFAEATSGDGIVSYGLTHGGYDLRLGHNFRVAKNTYGEHIDPAMFRVPGYQERLFDSIRADWGRFVLPARGSVLAESMETLRIPRFLTATCVGKSTWARCFVIANTTPLEPEWEGVLTIELSNLSDSPVVLHVGQGIAQLRFERLDAEPETSYADKQGIYQGQTGVTPPRVRS